MSRNLHNRLTFLEQLTDLLFKLSHCLLSIISISKLAIFQFTNKLSNQKPKPLLEFRFYRLLSSIIKNTTFYQKTHFFSRNHKSKLFGFNRKSIIPITTIPSSFRQSLILSFTTMIFLKESPIRTREFFSCSILSLSGMEKADWI